MLVALHYDGSWGRERRLLLGNTRDGPRLVNAVEVDLQLVHGLGLEQSVDAGSTLDPAGSLELFLGRSEALEQLPASLSRVLIPRAEVLRDPVKDPTGDGGPEV